MVYTLRHTQLANSPRRAVSRLQNVSVCISSAQEWTNRTPNTTNLSIPCFLVLPGSESTITEITEYVYFSRIWSDCELQYKIE